MRFEKLARGLLRVRPRNDAFCHQVICKTELKTFLITLFSPYSQNKITLVATNYTRIFPNLITLLNWKTFQLRSGLNSYGVRGRGGASLPRAALRLHGAIHIRILRIHSPLSEPERGRG